MSIVCSRRGIPRHAQTAKTKPFLLLLFGPRNEASAYQNVLCLTTRNQLFFSSYTTVNVYKQVPIPVHATAPNFDSSVVQ